MEIIRKEKNKYLVKLDNENLSLNDETILYYKTQKQMSICEILKYDLLMDNYKKIVNKIKYKLRSEKEIKDFLAKENLNREDIVLIIDKLQKNKLINDHQYIESFVNDKVNLSNIGPYKIKEELLKNGLKETEVINKLNQVEKSMWLTKINKEIEKRIKNNKRYSKRELKNNITKYLIQRGYDITMIQKELNNYDIKEDSEILQKQYEKLIRKNDSDKVIQKLIQKGYSLSQIKNIKD